MNLIYCFREITRLTWGCLSDCHRHPTLLQGTEIYLTTLTENTSVTQPEGPKQGHSVGNLLQWTTNCLQHRWSPRAALTWTRVSLRVRGQYGFTSFHLTFRDEPGLNYQTLSWHLLWDLELCYLDSSNIPWVHMERRVHHKLILRLKRLPLGTDTQNGIAAHAQRRTHGSNRPVLADTSWLNWHTLCGSGNHKVRFQKPSSILCVMTYNFLNDTESKEKNTTSMKI